MGNIILEDRMRVALSELLRAQPLILSGITELKQQGYTTEAANLDTALASLITATNAAIAAVAAAS